MPTRYKTVTGRVTSALRHRLNKTQLDDVLRSQHLARDLGLPHRPPQPRGLGQW